MGNAVLNILPANEELLQLPQQNEPDIERRFELMKATVSKAVIELFFSLDTELGRLAQKYYAQQIGQSDPNKDTFGLVSMGGILTLVTRGIDEAVIENENSLLWPLYKYLVAYYTLENITDDICTVVENDEGLEYPHKEMMSGFYTIVIDLIEGRLTYNEAIKSVLSLQYDEAAEKLIPESIVEMAKSIAQLTNEDIPEHLSYAKNPLQLAFVLNLQAIDNVVNSLKSLKQKLFFPQLSVIIDRCMEGLGNRYKSSITAMQIPNDNFENALEVSKKTILTDFHSTYTIIAAAVSDPKIMSRVEALQVEIITAIDCSNMINRILNEAGIAALKPTEAYYAIAQLSKTSVHTGSVRSLLQVYNETVENSGYAKLVARISKDAVEDEGNIVLDTKNGDHSQGSLQAFRANLIKVNQELIGEVMTLKQKLTAIGNIYPSTNLIDFLIFEYYLYSVKVKDGGEYIKTDPKLVMGILHRIFDEEDPMIILNKILQDHLQETQ